MNVLGEVESLVVRMPEGVSSLTTKRKWSYLAVLIILLPNVSLNTAAGGSLGHHIIYPADQLFFSWFF